MGDILPQGTPAVPVGGDVRRAPPELLIGTVTGGGVGEKFAATADFSPDRSPP
jgi:hypothetical protein